MKKLLSMLLASAMVLSLAACGGGGGGQPAASTPASSTPASSTPASSTPSDDPMAELIEAAQAEGELVVYGSCEEDYLAAACQKFEELYGIKTTYQRLSTG